MPKRGAIFTTKQSFGKVKKTKLSKGVSASTVAAAVKKAIMKVAEIKELTNSQDVTQVTLGGQVIALNQIAEGTEINQRVGRHVTPAGIDIRIWTLNVDQTAMDYVYVACVWDRQPDGSTPTFSTIFDTASSAVSGLVFKNTLQYRDRFTILWEEHSVNQDCNVANYGNYSNVLFRRYKKLDKFNKCEYVGSSAATPSTGGLYLCACTYKQSAGPSNTKLAYVAKFTYTDF